MASSDFPWDEESIIHKIDTSGLDRIVICGIMPGTVKTFFQKPWPLQGAIPNRYFLPVSMNTGYCLRMTQVSAKSLLACTITDVPFETVALPGEAPVNHSHPGDRRRDHRDPGFT